LNKKNNMKKIHFICLLFGMSMIVNAQKMSKSHFNSLDKNNKSLYEKLIVQDSLRTLRIDTYINSNPSISKIKYDRSTNKTYVLKDVIEGKPVYVTTHNEDAAKATGTNHLQVGGSLGLDLDGTNFTVGVWDGGALQTNHTEFLDATGTSSRVVNMETLNTNGTNDLSSHGTHVSGTIGARGARPSAKGMATNVSIRAYNFNNDSPEMLFEATNPGGSIILSNHSYGVPVDQGGGSRLDPWLMGAYSQDAVVVDEIASLNPKYLMVFSAGNDGNVSYTGGMYFSSDKLTGDKNAKNALVVANASPSINPFTNEVSFTINSSSSQGPTDDLRVKPDIAGDGTGLESPVPTDSYATFSGTSMSAPNVTGSLVLLQQYYNQIYGDYMKSSTLRGLVCHTAKDDAQNIGPDPIFGWGLLDARLAAETITASNNGEALVQELSLNNNQTYTYSFTAQSGDKLSATICWTDIKGVALSGSQNLNNSSPRLINDLDIRISKDGVEYLPWKLDYSSISGFSNSKADNNVDNIERIDIEAPTSGTYTLSVSHKGTLQSVGPFDPKIQDYALILTGANLVLSTDEVALTQLVKVFPNPSNGEFTISFDSEVNDAVKVDVYDISGRAVYNNVFMNTSSQFTKTIDLTGLKSGVYIANIVEGGRTSSHKLIIE
jgi:hypothetical protein